MSKAKKPKMFAVGKGKYTAKELERFFRYLRSKDEWPLESENDELRFREFLQYLTPGFRQGMLKVPGLDLCYLLDYLHDEKLTFCEWQIAVLLRAYPFIADKEIADKLGKSIKTVNVQMAALISKSDLSRERLAIPGYASNT